MNLLTVIDMQTLFAASKNFETIENVKKEIQFAVENQWWIFFVEYDGYGVTRNKILNFCKGYPRQERIMKFGLDGADEIYEAILVYLQHIPKKIRVCGTNTSQCLFSTVNGLSYLLRDVTTFEIVKNACNDTSAAVEKYGLDPFSLFKVSSQLCIV